MNIHEGFQIGTRVQIDDTTNEYRFHGKHGVVIDHWSFYQSKVFCDDGSVWVGNRFRLSRSQRPTKYEPGQWESAPFTGIVPPLSLSTSQSESTPPTCG